MATEVYIVWGTSQTIRDNGEASISGYKFDTPEELEAFLLGVDAGCGWMEYEQFDSREEALEFVKESQ